MDWKFGNGEKERLLLKAGEDKGEWEMFWKHEGNCVSRSQQAAGVFPLLRNLQSDALTFVGLIMQTETESWVNSSLTVCSWRIHRMFILAVLVLMVSVFFFPCEIQFKISTWQKQWGWIYDVFAIKETANLMLILKNSAKLSFWATFLVGIVTLLSFGKQKCVWSRLNNSSSVQLSNTGISQISPPVSLKLSG